MKVNKSNSSEWSQWLSKYSKHEFNVVYIKPSSGYLKLKYRELILKEKPQTLGCIKWVPMY